MVTITCPCGAKFKVYPYRVKTAKYCSKACAAKYTNNAWKGGRIVKPNGYIMIRVGKRYVYEHRYVMEQMLGRTLEPWEVVHHKNGKKADNRKSNLVLMSKRKHDSMETKKRWEENPKTFEGRERCGAPRIGRHGKGKFCKHWKPCPYHKGGDAI